MTEYEIERGLSAKMNRRDAADERSAKIYDAKAAKAARFIGQLCREGRTVYYVWPPGGKYREGSHFDLTAFLIRNAYV